MGPVSRSAVTLRIAGDNLDPEQISNALGAEPSRAHRKGERISRISTRGAPWGQWHLRAADRSPANVDDQVAEVFGKLTSDLSVWSGIASDNKIDLFVGLFLADTNQGIELSPRSLVLLSDRGATLGLDIYGPEYGDATGDA